MANQNKYVTISGVSFINIEKSQFLNSILIPRIKNEEKTFIVTANPEIVDRTIHDHEYKEAVLRSDFTVADGVGILVAAKMNKMNIKERIAGYDLLVDLLEFGNEERLKVYLLGAEESVNKKASDHVKVNFPNVEVVGRHHGFFDMNDDRIAKEINETKPDIIFVALGVPRQENWIHNNIDQFNKGVFMGVGGSFDVLAGTVKRAPDMWIKLNLEWLYRMMKQPERFGRNLKILKFMIRQLPIFKRK
ncbi:acetylglucosaminyldiphosphoundecaprenol acetyl-beta-D-mannosaminyltransferase [Phocicoccus schoeneichii]|uniref:N-acetylmannosaminyltransferase n=1 Tax=Phocicoccus schoeneichii TaxID=1812261 RepID=A0A6V7R848_9BACL|nr:WecB/TagA/CpsF family glycosyltransferase [Jeotgalicoccus schoeneichii]GGH50236.1 acetylglucosaminyldiphosphoundecaprenol acetyl-beta-D-mannosaminyltransferase [Jeotgalicoccus schoeneichii]CAD2072982.1 Putative N-acetylmannosaminyltransferase [Jeotgalicoccus schoeneichii]